MSTVSRGCRSPLQRTSRPAWRRQGHDI